jgi:TetR/AcrR family transcriptional regulator, regulator of autoinduction and epiphytic fitness
MDRPSSQSEHRRDAILLAVIPVFGRFGFRKTSVDELAAAAGLSKQGLYLHFSSKEEVFREAMNKYLRDGLDLVDRELARPGATLHGKLMGAMDAWFGRHLATFAPESFDVIEAGDRLSAKGVAGYKDAFQAKIAEAISRSAEFRSSNVCTPAEVARVLFLLGLTWKEERPSRTELMARFSLCIRACCQIDAGQEAK